MRQMIGATPKYALRPTLHASGAASRSKPDQDSDRCQHHGFRSSTSFARSFSHQSTRTLGRQFFDQTLDVYNIQLSSRHKISSSSPPLFNLLGIYFIGKALENFLNPRQLGTLFFGSVLSGSIVWLAANWGQSGSTLIGASAGVLGLLTYFCMTRPNEPVTFLLFFS